MRLTSELGNSAVFLVAEYVNVHVMQTLSKSFGLAQNRCVSTPASPRTHVSHRGLAQTRHSNRSTTTHSDPLGHQGTVHLHANCASRVTCLVPCVAQRHAPRISKSSRRRGKTTFPA